MEQCSHSIKHGIATASLYICRNGIISYSVKKWKVVNLRQQLQVIVFRDEK